MIVVWLPRATADLFGQIDHIAEDDPRAAIEQGDRVMDDAGRLADHPEMGRIGRIPGTRELVTPRTPFVTVYRLRRDLKRVEILRVLHGAQQWPPPNDA